MTALLSEIEAFMEAANVSDHRAGIILADNGRLVERLRGGGRLWPETEAKVRIRLKEEGRKRAASFQPVNASRPVQGSGSPDRRGDAARGGA